MLHGKDPTRLRNLLQTKLRPTFVASQLLPRVRLLGLLENSSNVRLVVVHGAAGSGKSSLLCEFVSSRPLSVAWFSLTETDQEPKIFLTYFLGALQGAFGNICPLTQEMADAPFPSDAAETATLLVNELLECPQKLTLILDDYHLVDKIPWVGQFMDILVRQGPPNLTLVLASRERPELPLPYLRAKGQLIEIRQSDLRFSEAEVGQLFCDVWNHPLADDLIKTLHAKTEGWVTGLSLVAQSIQSLTPENLDQYIASLQGNDQFIYEYLASEVFVQQPPEVQEFLKFTAIPERFNVDLANHLTESEDCFKLLHYLDSARLFLVHLGTAEVEPKKGTAGPLWTVPHAQHLDAGQEWFRYHHLFGEFLRRRLAIEDGLTRVHALHSKTARWYEDRNELSSAIPHYLEGKQQKHARRLLETVGSELLGRGLQATVASWLEQFPSRMRHQPGLRTLQAELWDYQANWARAVEEYRQALTDYRQAGDQAGETNTLEKLALCLLKYGETGQLLSTCEEGMRRCPPENLALNSMLRSWYGTSHIYVGRDWQKAYALLQESHALATQSGDPRALSWACMTQGFSYHFTLGNFIESLRTLNEGIEFFRDLGWWMAVFQLSMNKAVVLAVQGDHAHSLELTEEMIELAEEAGHSWVAKGLESLRAMVYVAQHRLDECEAALGRFSEGHLPAQMKPWYHRTRMLLHLLSGKSDQALVDSQQMERALQFTGYGFYAPECWLAEGFRLWKMGENESARQILERCMHLCRQADAKFSQMKTHQLEAAIAHHNLDYAKLENHLKASLALTETNGYGIFWLTEGFGISIPLLMWARSKDLHKSLVDGLLQEADTRIRGEIDRLSLHPCPLVRKETLKWLANQGAQAADKVQKIASDDEDASVRQAARQALRILLPKPETLRIFALGRLQIVRNDESVLAQARPGMLKLLRYFLSQPDKLLSVLEITEVFWPEATYDKARHNLSAHVSLIRKALGTSSYGDGDFILREGEGYKFQLNDIEYDVDRFEKLVAAAREAHRNGQFETFLSATRKAQELYKGDFLEEDPYTDAVNLRRAELKNQLTGLLELVADHYLARGLHEEAVNRYRDLCRLDDSSEKTVQKLLQALGASGDRAGAKREYQAYRARLWETLGLHPDPSTEELILRL